ncbi:MAG: carbohydrate kinase [Candidatus Sumerlaeota bacterium]|nr:carbohydrate kinase [Candidatus Sumerlaeota bacterium]
MTKYLLGIDNGCTVSKAALFDLDGREIAVAARKSETLTPKPDWFERDAAAMWRETAEAIREVITKSKVNAADIACVACTGHGNGLYLIDEQGKPTRAAIVSMDCRARNYTDQWIAQGLHDVVLPKTMQSIWPGAPNALLRWLKDNEPQTMARSRWMLMVKDFVRFKLCGKVQAELTDFSALSLMDLNTRRFDPELFALWGIGDLLRLMPPLVETAQICGTVTREAAAQTGLKEGTPVAGGMFDVDACGLASGLVDENQLCMIAGTWGNNQFISTKPVMDKEIYMTSCYSIPGYYLMLEGSPTSASNYEWFATEFFRADLALPENKGKSVYQIGGELLKQLKPDMSGADSCGANPNSADCSSDPGDRGLFFLPFVWGANAHPDAKGCFIGLTARYGRGDLVRAVFEGVVFSHRWHVERLMKFTAMPGCIRLTGGAAKSEDWTQIFSDCFQVPVQIPDGSELGGLGAAIAAGVAAGCFKDFRDATEKMVHFSRTQKPNPGRKAYYEEKYRRYKRILAALDPVWKDIRS